ncbi:MAG TPA: serine/threonine-protein kinase [Kofleriaceae bacterium]
MTHDRTEEGRDTEPGAEGSPTPTMFGNPERYVMLGEHGRGGLGRVSRAHDRGLGRDVAIKELLSRSSVDEIRFLREALITARLEHPGIVPIHEAGRWPDGTPFYAMKLVAGRSLRELLAERTTAEQRLGLLHHVIAVANAIAYAHDRKIIHRDLKPSNVMVGDFGETIVIDWGIAKDLSESDDPGGAGEPQVACASDLTQPGSVLGTRAYMSPEQARGEPVDQRSDVFAIGAMLWELCSPEPLPDDPGRRNEVLGRAGIDDDLVAIIDKAVDPDPGRRYRDAGALAADLKAFNSGARIAARDYSLYASLTHWIRRHRGVTLAALAFVVLLIAGITALAVLYRASSRNAETARDRLIQSYEEQGRRLLLDGDYLRALPYLAEAYAQGDRSIAVRFLLARAQRLASAQRVLHTQAGRTRGAAFRPDGGNILSVADDGEAAIWSASTGQTVAALPARPGGPYSATVSRDGAFAAIALPDGVTVWDGSHARTIATGRAERLAIDASGARIAVVAGGALSVWSVATGERSWTASAGAPVIQLMWSGDAVIMVGVDTIARIADGRTVVPLAASGPVFGAFTNGTGAIATVFDRGIDVWDTAGARLATIRPPLGVQSVAFSRDGGRIAVACVDGIVRIYGDAGTALLSELVGHRGGAKAMEFSDDGSRLATVGNDLTLRIWDAVRYRPITSLLGARDAYAPVGLRFDATGQRVIAATAQGEIRVFTASDPDAQTSVSTQETAMRTQFFDGSQRFITAGMGELRLWSTTTGAQHRAVDQTAGSQAALSPDGTKLAIITDTVTDDSKGADGEIRDAATHGLLGRFHGSGQLGWAGFDHASQRVLTVSSDRTAELWSLQGERIAMFPGSGRRALVTPFQPAFSPDDSRIAVARSDKVAAIWDVASRRELGSVTIAGGVSSVRFDATGTQFLTSGSDRVVRLWDATTFSLRGSFDYSGAVRIAAISPDGTLIAASTTDGMVNISDRATSSLLTQFHDVDVFDVVFAPDGELLISSGVGGAVVWHLGLETRSPEDVSEFVRCRAPYRLVETRLEPATPVCGDASR